MFIKSVTLARNHWSYKLQKWMFPSLPRFYNFCPHFWMTILSFFLAPIKLMIIAIFYPPSLFLSWVVNKVEIMQSKSAEKFLANVSDYDLFLARKHFLFDLSDSIEYIKIPRCEIRRLVKIHNKARVCSYDRYYNINVWRSENTDQQIQIDEWYKQLREYLDSLKTEQTQKKATQIKNKPWWPTAIKVSKYSSAAILLPTTAFIAYYLFMFLGWCWYWIWKGLSTVNWGEIGFVLLIVVGLLTSLLIFVGLARYIGSKIIDKVCVNSNGVKKVVFFIPRVIKNVFVFFWSGIKLLKSDNCPEINWKD